MQLSLGFLRFMFKVVMISPLPPERAGESAYTAKLIEKLAINENVRIYAITGSDANELPSKSDNIITLRIWNGRSFCYPFILLRTIVKIRPHIVHVQFGPHGAVYGGFFGEPMLLLLILLRLTGIKTTITLHSTWMTDQVQERVSTYDRTGRLSILAKPLFRFFMKLLDLGTTRIQLSTVKTGSLLKQEFVQEYGFSDDDIDEIPHPCTPIVNRLNSTDALQKMNLTGHSIILVFGYIRRGKGFEIALQALSIIKQRISNVLLLIAGNVLESDDKVYLAQLKQMSKNIGVERWVRFDSRYIPDDEIPLYFSAASIILIPYTESVGASGPMHNYAGYGVPIIAADVGYHMREALGGTITLFENQNPKDLAKKVIDLLNNPQRRADLGRRQQNYVDSESWDVALKRTMQNYKHLIS